MMNVNVDERVVTREPAEHIGHGDVSQLRIAVMKSIKKMKDDAFNDPDIDLKAIYDRNVKCLTLLNKNNIVSVEIALKA